MMQCAGARRGVMRARQLGSMAGKKWTFIDSSIVLYKYEFVTYNILNTDIYMYDVHKLLSYGAITYLHHELYRFEC